MSQFVINGTSITVTIKWAIATKYNGIDLVGSTVILEVHAQVTPTLL
jgi:hypothetical protein